MTRFAWDATVPLPPAAAQARWFDDADCAEGARRRVVQHAKNVWEVQELRGGRLVHDRARMTKHGVEIVSDYGQARARVHLVFEADDRDEDCTHVRMSADFEAIRFGVVTFPLTRERFFRRLREDLDAHARSLGRAPSAATAGAGNSRLAAPSDAFKAT